MVRRLPAPESEAADLAIYDPGPNANGSYPGADEGTVETEPEPDFGAFADTVEGAFENLLEHTYDFAARLKNGQLKTLIDKDGILTIELTLVVATNPQGIGEAMKPLLDLIGDTNPGTRLAVSVKPLTKQGKLPL